MLLSELNYHILKKKKKEKVNENELPTTQSTKATMKQKKNGASKRQDLLLVSSDLDLTSLTKHPN